MSHLLLIRTTGARSAPFSLGVAGVTRMERTSREGRRAGGPDTPRRIHQPKGCNATRTGLPARDRGYPNVAEFPDRGPGGPRPVRSAPPVSEIGGNTRATRPGNR